MLVPPGWDSWGKIRVLSEKFDVEGISNGWSVDISPGFTTIHDDVEGGAVDVYVDMVKDRNTAALDSLSIMKNRGIEVPPVDTQEFLAAQMEVLERREEGEKQMMNRYSAN